MIEKAKVIKRIKAQIALCKEIDSDWISLTVETGKRILELLNEQPVRCRDCVHYRRDGYCTYNNHEQADPGWYCADGKSYEIERRNSNG